VQQRLATHKNEIADSIPSSPKTENLYVEMIPENIVVKEEIEEVEVEHELDSNDDRSVPQECVEERSKKRPKKLRKTKNASKVQKSFKHQRFLSNNERLHLVAEYFKMQCDKCTFSFDSWNDVCPHFEREHGIQGYLICSVCDRKVTKRYFVMDHIEYHMNPDAFK
jgi:uncharacterized protein YhaN